MHNSSALKPSELPRCQLVIKPHKLLIWKFLMRFSTLDFSVCDARFNKH